MKSLFISYIFLIFCSLTPLIPEWVIEKSLKVLVRKQQEVSLWKSLKVLGCMILALACLVLTYLVCALVYESCRAQYHGEVGLSTVVGVK